MYHLTYNYNNKQDAQLTQRDRAAGCVIVFAKSRRLELGDNIYHCDIIGLKSVEFRKKCKIRAITAFKVIQSHRGQYQSKARMLFSISD